MEWIAVAKQLLSNISNSATPEQHIALAQAQVLIALVEEQRKTNEHLARIADCLNFDAMEGTLDDMTVHPRSDWPGHCGMEDDE